MRPLLAGAKLRFARVKAANLEIFSSLGVYGKPCDPEATIPMSLSIHLLEFAIFTLRVVFLSEMVHRISKQPSLVSRFLLSNRFTRTYICWSFISSRYSSFPADKLSLLKHSMH